MKEACGSCTAPGAQFSSPCISIRKFLVIFAVPYDAASAIVAMAGFRPRIPQQYPSFEASFPLACVERPTPRSGNRVQRTTDSLPGPFILHQGNVVEEVFMMTSRPAPPPRVDWANSRQSRDVQPPLSGRHGAAYIGEPA